MQLLTNLKGRATGAPPRLTLSASTSSILVPASPRSFDLISVSIQSGSQSSFLPECSSWPALYSSQYCLQYKQTCSAITEFLVEHSSSSWRCCSPCFCLRGSPSSILHVPRPSPFALQLCAVIMKKAKRKKCASSNQFIPRSPASFISTYSVSFCLSGSIYLWIRPAALVSLQRMSSMNGQLYTTTKHGKAIKSVQSMVIQNVNRKKRKGEKNTERAPE